MIDLLRKPPTSQELLLAHSSPAGMAIAAAGIPTRGELWWRYKLQAVVNRWLVDIAAGRKRFVILTAPPRHGKSVLVAQWLPAWWLGHNPDHEVAVASNTSELAEEHGGNARDIMHAYGERYFGLTVRGGKKAGANGWQIDGRRGRMHAIGKGGTFTGKGAHLLIVDDPIKDRAEAYSPSAREKLWKWWTGVARKRLNPGGARVVVMFTRWHEDDLVGRLLERDKQRGLWDVLNIPALAVEEDPIARKYGKLGEDEPYVDPVGREPGQALWPVLLDGSPGYPVDELQEMKEEDEEIFEAQHQGNPQPPSGVNFNRAYYRYGRDRGPLIELKLPEGATRIVSKDECLWFGTADFAAGKGATHDPCAFLIGAITPAPRALIVVNVTAEKLGLGEQWYWMKGRWRGFPYLYRSGEVSIEDKQGAHAAIGMCEAEVANGDWPHELGRIKAVTDKIERARPAAHAYKSGRIFHLDEGSPWCVAFEEQLSKFPAGTHDDMVDCLAYAWLYVDKQGGAAEMIGLDPDGTVTTSWEEEEGAESVAAEPDDDSDDEFGIVEAPPQEKKRRRRRGGLFR